MRDNFLVGGLDSKASQKDDEEDERYREGVCGIFMVLLCLSNLFGLKDVSGGTEMPQHLVTASTVLGLGGTETIAWGAKF